MTFGLKEVETRINSLISVLLLLTVIGWPSYGHCVPLAYDEAADGDLSHIDVVVLDLGEGSNTITGDFFFNAQTPSLSYDYDPFAFRVPAGTYVGAISFDFWTDYVEQGDADDGIQSAQTSITLSTAAVSGETAGINLLGASPVAPWDLSTLPMIGAGVGEIYYDSMSCAAGDMYTTDYTWTLDVRRGTGSPVPEPATMLLFSAGLAGFGVFRKKFKK